MQIMSKVALRLSLQCLDMESLEYKSSLGQKGKYSFEMFGKNYLRLSSKKRSAEDFDRNNFIFYISSPTVITLKNVMVSRFGIPYRKNKYVPDALNTYNDIENFTGRHSPTPVTKNRLKKIYYRLRYKFIKSVPVTKIKTDKAPILFFDHYFFNFTHFVLESYPRLFWIRKHYPGHPILLPPPQNEGGYDYYQHINPCLEALGIKPDECITLGHENYLFHEVIMPSHVKFHPHHVPQAIEHLKAHFFDSSFKSDNDKIFISREKSLLRDIGNYEEVEAVLCQKYGFKKVIMEQVAFYEKINLMSTAKYLVSCDSSSISNCIFMPENSTVLAFRVLKMPIYNFILTSLFNIKFLTQVCSFTGKNKGWYSGKLYVDPNILEERLKAMFGG